MLICQISDLHIKAHGRLSYRVVDTTAMLRVCLDSIRALPQAPDIVVATGDLVDLGRPEEYQTLRTLLDELAQPVFLLPGNHDDRAALRAAFPEHTYLFQNAGRINYVIDRFAVRLVGIDTIIPGEPGGVFEPATAHWLDEVLGHQPERPTLLMLHHPPFATGIVHMDDIGLAGAAALEEVVRRHPQVERIICGHLHRSISSRFGGTIASTCPSPAHQVVLDFSAEAAAQFIMEPPGYQLHRWTPQGLVTHSVVIGRFPGPFPFAGDERPA